MLLTDAAQKYAGQLLIAKVDAEAEAPLLARFALKQTPALLFTKAGHPEGKLIGTIAVDQTQAWINYLVHGGAAPNCGSGANERKQWRRSAADADGQ